MAKLIQAKLNSDYFKNWIINELKGYEKESSLPDCREFNTRIITAMDPTIALIHQAFD